MAAKICPHCDQFAVAEVEVSRKIQLGRRKINVDGFLTSRCGACGFEFSNAEQIDKNCNLMNRRSENVRGAVFPGLLRSIREVWQINQRQLSKMLGAGASAVGKWEAGGAMSGPSALLAQCAANVPGTVEFLAHLANVEINHATENKEYNTHISMPLVKKNHRAPFYYGAAPDSVRYMSASNDIYKEALVA